MNTEMRAAEMTDWASYLFKLAVLRDLFEIREIGDQLRDNTYFTYSNAAIGQYFKGARDPSPDFFDYVRQALELTDEEYQTLLFLYHRSRNTPTPLQKQQMQYFQTDLLRRIMHNIGGSGDIGNAGAAS